MHRNNRHCELRGVWSVTEHERFIEAIGAYPCGPWRLIADHIGTRSIKQVQTHAQKYQQKLMRHQRGLRKRKTKLKVPEHRVDQSTIGQFKDTTIVRSAKRKIRELERAADRAHSPSSFTEDVFNIMDVSDDDWTMLTTVDPNDSAVIDLLNLVPDATMDGSTTKRGNSNDDIDDDDDIVPNFDELSPNGWNEWQLDDLLQPEVVDTTLEASKGAHLDGSELPAAEVYV